MNILELYTQDVSEPRKAGAREYQGPCPDCGGDDRFCIFPEQGSDKAPGMGTYHCGHGKGGNGCGKGGDAIQYLIDFRGMEFKPACGLLGIEVKGRMSGSYYRPPVRRKAKEKGFVPAVLDYPEHVIDPVLWSKKGLEFVDKCHAALLDRQQAVDYLAGRGIGMTSIKKFRLGFHGGQKRKDVPYSPAFRPWVSWGLRDEKKANGRGRMLILPAGLVVPYIVDGQLHRLTIRLLKRDERNPKKKYHYVVGSMRDVWLSNPSARAFVIAEAELDCIAMDEFAGDLVGTVGIGSTGVKPETRAAAALEKSICILNALDSDRAGAKAGVWWKETYPQSKRWPVPVGKDPGEAFAAGVDLRRWIMEGLPPVFQDIEEPCRAAEVPLVAEASSPAPAPEKKAAAAGYRVIDLPDGREICLTDDRQEWQRLAESGKIVFSSHELERMQLACTDLEPEEAEILKSMVLDTKEVFGAAYIYHGKKADTAS